MGQRHDHDTPWKEALSKHLAQFFAFFFPDIHDDIDWSCPPHYLDKELRKLAPHSKTGPRTTDSLVEVRRHDGAKALVLVHIEVQSHLQADFAERMLDYHARLVAQNSQPVCSLAILADSSKSWRPAAHEKNLWGCRYLLEFPIAKLADYRPRVKSLERSTNPFALLVAATLHVHDTNPASPARRVAKFRLVRGLYTTGLSPGEVKALFLLVDWVMTLTPDQNDIFDEDLQQFERSRDMPYIISTQRNYMAKGEQLGLEKGLERGLEQGREEGLESLRAAVLLALRSRFGNISETITTAVQSISDRDRLIALVGIAASAPTLVEVEPSLQSE